MEEGQLQLFPFEKLIVPYQVALLIDGDAEGWLPLAQVQVNFTGPLKAEVFAFTQVCFVEQGAETQGCAAAMDGNRFFQHGAVRTVGKYIAAIVLTGGCAAV